MKIIQSYSIFFIRVLTAEFDGAKVRDVRVEDGILADTSSELLVRAGPHLRTLRRVSKDVAFECSADFCFLLRAVQNRTNRVFASLANRPTIYYELRLRFRCQRRKNRTNEFIFQVSTDLHLI